MNIVLHLLLILSLSSGLSYASGSKDSADVEMAKALSKGKRAAESDSDEESAAPPHPLKRGRQANPLDVFDVVSYFLTKDKTRIEERKREAIDPLKLQKLLYYAQGYYLARENQRLFNADITENYHGPFIREVHNRYGGYTIAPESIPEIDPNQVVSKLGIKVIQHLEMIYKMFYNFTGKQLEAKTHKEDPWKNAYRYQVITDESMAKYFKEADPEQEYLNEEGTLIGQFVTFIKEVDSGKITVHEFRKKAKDIVSRGRDIKDLIFMKEALNLIENAKGEKVEDPKDELVRVMWPHQTVAEATGGYIFLPTGCDVLSDIFFPTELLNTGDAPITLYGRLDIQYKLAFSAQYRNPIALQHLARMLKLYSTEAEEDPLILAAREFEAQAKDFFENTLREEVQAHPFLKGLSATALEDEARARAYFTQAGTNDPNDGEALWYAASFEENDERAKIRYAQAEKVGYKKALLGQANMASEKGEKFKLYVQAGDAEIPAGYFQAAKMLEGGYQPPADYSKDALDYLEKAGRLGMAVAYSAAADIARSHEDINKVKEYYEKRGQLGYPDGYYKLAQVLEGEGQNQQAFECYLKAFPLMGGEEAARLASLVGRGSGRKIEKDFKDTFTRYFNDLIKISRNQEASIDGE